MRQPWTAPDDGDGSDTWAHSLRNPARSGGTHGLPGSMRPARLDAALSFLGRGTSPATPATVRALAVFTMSAGAALVAISAFIHLHLWLQGYRHIHLIGPLFLAQAIAGILLATVMIVVRRVATALVGALYMASTAAGLMLSAWVGLFGFHDGLDVPWATSSLLIELAGLGVLAVATVVLAVRQDERSDIHSTPAGT